MARPRQYNRKKIARLYQAGHSMQHIADMLQCARNTVRFALIGLDIPCRPPSQCLPVDTDYIAREYQHGRSGRELASELHVSDNTIYDRLQRVGVARRAAQERPRDLRWCVVCLQPSTEICCQHPRTALPLCQHHWQRHLVFAHSTHNGRGGG